RAKPRLFYAEFADAGGLAPGAKVLMAGVKIGSVTKVKLANPKLARLTLNIDEGIHIPVGTSATVQGSLTGLGDTPLVLIPPDISSESDMAEG
ncbi:MlaD family protein, partial [Acinetobacter baumannii]